MHLRDYLEHLKSKPEQVRRQIALGSSIGVTGLVAVGWLVALSTSGTLALTPADPAAARELAEAADQTRTGFGSLLGAASAFNAGTSGSEPSLTIVEGEASSTLERETDTTEGKTVIPF